MVPEIHGSHGVKEAPASLSLACCFHFCCICSSAAFYKDNRIPRVERECVVFSGSEVKIKKKKKKTCAQSLHTQTHTLLTKQCSQLEAGFTSQAEGLCRSQRALFSTHPPALVPQPSPCPARQKRASERAYGLGPPAEWLGRKRRVYQGRPGRVLRGSPGRQGSLPGTEQGREQGFAGDGSKD